MDFLQVQIDGFQLFKPIDSLIFPPNFSSNHLVQMACSRETKIGMTVKDYIAENETLLGSELKELLDLITSGFIQYREERRKREGKDCPPEIFKNMTNPQQYCIAWADTTEWTETYVYFHNIDNIENMKAKINDNKYYTISLGEEILERNNGSKKSKRKR